MIVQCTNCRARFRVADDKVPDRGVKVRCTKCATVFRVTKADAVDAKPGTGRDPFGLDTGRQTPSPTGATPLPGGTGPQRQSGGFDGLDLTGPIVSQTGPQSRTGPQVKETTGAHAGAPRLANFPQSVSLTYGAASPHQTLDLELSLGPPSPSSATIPVMPAPPLASPAPAPFVPMAPPMTPQSASAIDAALSAAMGIGDPFADLNLGAAPPRNYSQPAPVDPFAEVAQAPAYGMPPPAAPAFNDPFAVDFGAANQGPPPMPTPMPTVPDPFGMGPGPAASFARPHHPPPRQPPAAPPAADPWMNLLASQPKKEETDPFAGLDAPPGEPAREPSAPARPPEPKHEPTVDPKNEPAGGLRVTATGEFEMEATRGHKLDLDYGPGSELDGFRAPEPKPAKKEKEKEKEKEPAPRESLEIGRIQLGKADADGDDKPKVADQKALARAKLRREVASAIFNVVCACIVMYSGIVAIAWVRTPRPIGFDDLGFPMVWLALGADGKQPADQLRASQIKSGIYPTRGGGELFYVEGLAHNGSSARQEALYAQVEIRRGDHVVERTDALAQLKATPEHLWALDSRKNDDLQKVLVKETPSLGVDSHNVAPFIAVFKLTAKDVEGCDVRVTVHPGVPATLQSVVSTIPKAPPQEPSEQDEGKPAVPEEQAQKQ